MKFYSQRQKNEDEELLEADATHVDMDAFQLLCHGRCWSCVASTNDLHDERDEIERYEGDC
jgi:hypothetical protein